MDVGTKWCKMWLLCHLPVPCSMLLQQGNCTSHKYCYIPVEPVNTTLLAEVGIPHHSTLCMPVWMHAVTCAPLQLMCVGNTDATQLRMHACTQSLSGGFCPLYIGKPTGQARVVCLIHSSQV